MALSKVWVFVETDEPEVIERIAALPGCEELSGELVGQVLDEIVKRWNGKPPATVTVAGTVHVLPVARSAGSSTLRRRLVKEGSRGVIMPKSSSRPPLRYSGRAVNAFALSHVIPRMRWNGTMREYVSHCVSLWKGCMNSGLDLSS